MFYVGISLGQSDTIAPKLNHQKDYIDFVYSNLIYPEIAVKNGIDGRVEFNFQITSAGCIDSIKIIRSPHEVLSNEVIRVLEETKCEWIPGKVDGIPMTFDVSSYINFKLE